MKKEHHLFPSLKENDYTKDGQPIYGGSIGMNKVYDHFVKEVDKAGNSPFRLIVINALTLIRNNYVPDYNKCTIGCKNDIQTLITYLSIYLRKKDKTERKVTILIMYPDYSKLPDSIRRPESPQLKRLGDIYKKDAKTVSSNLDKVYSDDVIDLFSVKLGNKQLYPHQSLNKLLMSQLKNASNKKDDFQFRMDDPIHLITHFSLDWHIQGYFKNVNLIESFTGNIVNSKYFGSKLIGIKDRKIPFDSIIHQTFGDKTLIKPLAVRRVRKSLLNNSIKWSMMTRSKIVRRISTFLDLPIVSLTKYTFE